MKLSNLQKALMVYRAYPRPLNSLELQTLYKKVHTGEHGFIERRSIDLRQRGLLERVGKPRTKRVQYVINEFGASLDITKIEQLPVVRRDEKVRSSREESIIKTECKEYQPPIQPTTLWGKIQFYFMRLFAGPTKT